MPNILIAHSDEEVRVMCRIALEKTFNYVFGTGDTQEALAFFRKSQDFHLVIVGEGNYSVASAVKRQNPKTPVLMLSRLPIKEALAADRVLMIKDDVVEGKKRTNLSLPIVMQSVHELLNDGRA